MPAQWSFTLALTPCERQAVDTFEFYATEHFRLSGVYWGLAALWLLGRTELLDQQEIVTWVLSCQKPSGGFGGSPRHDAHLLHTLSAVQVLAMYDQLDLLDASQVAACEQHGWPCCRAARVVVTLHVVACRCGGLAAA